MKPLHIALAAVAVALVVGATAFLLFGSKDNPAASQPTSAPLPSSSHSPGAGWTEEEMRNARGKDMTVGPSVEALVVGGGILAGATTAGILLVARRRSSSR